MVTALAALAGGALAVAASPNRAKGTLAFALAGGALAVAASANRAKGTLAFALAFTFRWLGMVGPPSVLFGFSVGIFPFLFFFLQEKTTRLIFV